MATVRLLSIEFCLTDRQAGWDKEIPVFVIRFVGYFV
jgi:hypothetical protein